MQGSAGFVSCARVLLCAVAVLASSLTLPVRAQETAPRLLKQDILAVGQAALNLQQARQVAAAGGLAVYVGSPAQDLVLREVSLRIDELAPIRYRYSDDEAAALRGGALHRIVLPLDGGPHRLRAEFIARVADAKPGTPRVRESFDGNVSQQGHITAVGLDLLKDGFMSRPTLQLRNVGDGAADPALRNAVFLSATGHHYAAVEAFQQLQMQAGGLPSGIFQQRLAASLEALGLGPAVDAGGGQQRYEQALRDIEGAAAAQALPTLDAIGKIEARDGESLSLRDRANLALGYYFLRARQGRSAVEAFNRVRSPGPYSTAALLGAGWAYLTADGSNDGEIRAPASAAPPPAPRQYAATPVTDDEIAEARRVAPFRRVFAVAESARAQDVRRALIPWIELIGRDPLDPAVQEGMLVVPYALVHLGAQEQAVGYYRQAIEMLELTRRRLDDSLRDVSAGKLAETIAARDGTGSWEWWLADVPDLRWWKRSDDVAPQAVYLKSLLDDAGFVQALDELRNLRGFATALDTHAQRLQTLQGDAEAAALLARIGALRAQLDTALAAAQSQLQSVALAELRAYRQHTDKYLVEAHYALARMNDRSEEGLAP